MIFNIYDMYNHFIYIHKNPTTFEVFYVGQGTHHKNKSKDRATSNRSRSKWWNSYVTKYGKPIVDIIFEGLDKQSADQIETFLIDFLGRKDIGTGKLINLTPGGDGRTWSEERKKLQSEKFTGEGHPMWGRKHDEEWRKNNSISHMGKKLSEETKKKMSESRTGLKRTKETKQKISEALTGDKNPMFGRVGEDNPASKLTWEKVNEIREKYKTGNYSFKKLAKLYNVSAYTIESVLKFRTWKLK